jgi:hypothetical protein
MSIIRRLALPGLAIPVVWLLFDVAYVRAGQPRNSVWFSGPIWLALYAALPVTLLWRISRDRAKEPLADGKELLVAVVAVAAWCVAAFIILVNVHLAIGGGL